MSDAANKGGAGPGASRYTQEHLPGVTPTLVQRQAARIVELEAQLAVAQQALAHFDDCMDCRECAEESGVRPVHGDLRDPQPLGGARDAPE